MRERLIASLMLALYRAGRQTDALDAFQAARRRLVDELGLEPGPELQELQRRILEHDPTLGAPRRLAPLSGPRRARWLVVGRAAGRRSRARSRACSCSSAGRDGPAGSGLAAGVSGDRGGRTPRRTVSRSATPLAGTPGSVAAAAVRCGWRTRGGPGVPGRSRRRVSVVDRIPVGAEPGSIVSGDGAVWVVSTVGSTVTRIDPSTETVAPPIHLPGANPGAIAYGAGRLWVADTVERELFEIDPATDALERTWQLDLQPSAIATGGRGGLGRRV